MILLNFAASKWFRKCGFTQRIQQIQRASPSTLLKYALHITRITNNASEHLLYVAFKRSTLSSAQK